MKTFTTTLFAVCAAALALTACQQQADKPEFAAIEKSEILHSGEKSFELDYRFEYLSWYSNDDVAARVRTSMIVDFFGEEYLKADPMESSKAFDQDVTGQYAEGTSGDYKWDGFMKMRSHWNLLNDRIVVYTIEKEEYMGGAHGMETVEYANYDLLTGGKLTLDDIFTPEGKAALADRICSQILADHNKDNWEELGEESCYFARSEIRPTENFQLSQEHITFLYNPYDIACFAQGRTKVVLPLNELDGFNKEVLVK